MVLKQTTRALCTDSVLVEELLSLAQREQQQQQQIVRSSTFECSTVVSYHTSIISRNSMFLFFILVR